MRQLIAQLALAAMLLFAQQVGIGHAVAHSLGHAPSHHHGKGLPTHGCDECMAFAQVHGAPGSVVIEVQSSAEFAAPQLEQAAAWTPLRTHAFSPRGPPPIS